MSHIWRIALNRISSAKNPNGTGPSPLDHRTGSTDFFLVWPWNKFCKHSGLFKSLIDQATFANYAIQTGKIYGLRFIRVHILKFTKCWKHDLCGEDGWPPGSCFIFCFPFHLPPCTHGDRVTFISVKFVQTQGEMQMQLLKSFSVFCFRLQIYNVDLALPHAYSRGGQLLVEATPPALLLL